MVESLVTASLLPTDYSSDLASEWQALLGGHALPEETKVDPAQPVVATPEPPANLMELVGSTVSSSHSFKWVTGFMADELPFEARLSPLGRQLLALRRADIASGMVLLDDDEILDEIAKRRGGLLWP